MIESINRRPVNSDEELFEIIKSSISEFKDKLKKVLSEQIFFSFFDPANVK